MIARISPLAALLPLALLAACNSAPAQPPLSEAPLAGATIGGEFDLVDTDGKAVKWADFAGKWRIVYFGYAYCPDICPFDVQRMMAGYEVFKAGSPELAKDLVPIFVTVDPARDTPAVIAEFTNAFSDDLVGLTGTQEQTDAAAKAFAVYHAKGEANAEGGYMVDHTRLAYLMDRDGKPVATLPVEQSGEAVAQEMARWVR